MIQKFKVHISEQQIQDLKNRLATTRWPDAMENSGWRFGADLLYIKELASYWEKEFDWRKTEQQINVLPNFIAEIDGYKIHFVHIEGKQKNSIPIIITHGWPGSFLEMTKLIPLLNSRQDISFHIIIPSLMGFGFSQKITEPGCNIFFIAKLWHKLMLALGYEKYVAQGGDFGSGVSTALAMHYPEYLTGLHLNYIPGNYFPYVSEKNPLTKEEEEFLMHEKEWYTAEGAYSHLQKTKPLTLAYALNDSPVGICAWIVEKFQGWADCKNDIESVFSKDELLANVSLYWFTETAHSSARLYYENSIAPMKFTENDFISTPTAIAKFDLEDPFPPRKYIERGFNIQRWTDFPEGGHFAAMEKPELLANDIIEFCKSIRRA